MGSLGKETQDVDSVIGYIVPCGEDELAVKSRPDHTCNSVASLMLLSLNHRSYLFICVFKERFLRMSRIQFFYLNCRSSYTSGLEGGG